MELNGILLVNKETGITSYGVVDKLKKISGAKKVGHTGTLDPMAEGLLVICFGKATKTISSLDSDKDYEAVMQLGITTDTLDKTGKISEEKDYRDITKEDIDRILPKFRGKISQIPPMFSAVKHEGKRLYELARKGIQVERKARMIEISKLELTDFTPPLVSLSIACSAGTYIRTLCDDMGKMLGCGAVMHSLIRTGVGDFKLGQAYKLAELENQKEIAEKIILID